VILGIAKTIGKVALKSSKKSFSKIGESLSTVSKMTKTGVKKNIKKRIKTKFKSKKSSPSNQENQKISPNEIEYRNEISEITSSDNDSKNNNKQISLKDETLDKLGKLLNLVDISGGTGGTKADQRQESIARAKFRDKSIEILEEIKDEVKDDESEKEEEKNSSKRSLKNKFKGAGTFISSSISDISKKVNSNKSDMFATLFLAVGSIWEIIQDLLGSIADAGGFIPWIKDNIGTFWNNFQELVDKEYGGWPQFIWAQIKETAEMVLWIADKVGEFLFGTTWKKSLEWWKLKFGLLEAWWDNYGQQLSDWWKYVQDIGITKYILEIIKNSINDVAKMILGDSAVSEMIDWWNEVNDSGGFLEYLTIKIQRWWEDFIIESSMYDWLKEALLGGRSIKDIQIARAEQDKLILQRKESRLEEDKKEEEARQKALNDYNERRKSTKSQYNKEKLGIYKQYSKNMSKIEHKHKKYINTSQNLIKPTKEKNRFTYIGNNSQSWMKVITSQYGVSESVRNGEGHSGVDFRAKKGDPITSITEGVVDSIQPHDKRGGLVLSIKGKDGVRTLYMHLSKVLVKVGDRISRGQVIAKAGNSPGKTPDGRVMTSHIHISVKKNGKTMDPLTYFNSLKYENNETLVKNEMKTKNVSIKGAKKVNNEVVADNANVSKAIHQLNKKIDEVKSSKVTSTIHESIREA